MGPIIYINVAIAGMMAFAALHYFLMWWWSRRERVLLIFSGYSAIVGLTTVIILRVMMVDSVDSAQVTLNLRTTFALLTYPLLLSVVSEIAAIRPYRILTFVTIACLLVSALSALGVPINGTVIGVRPPQFPWGETPTIVERQAGWSWAGPVYALIFFIQAYVIHVGWQTSRRDRLAGIVIMTTGATAILATIVPFLADVARMSLPYIGTFQFALWVPVLSLLLSRESALRDERLASSQERYRALIESAPDAIVVLDLGAGRFVEFNQQAVDMFGWPADELLSKSHIVFDRSSARRRSTCRAAADLTGDCRARRGDRPDRRRRGGRSPSAGAGSPQLRVHGHDRPGRHRSPAPGPGTRRQIDLLATDVVMPNMSGRELADRLRSEFAGLTVLFMSGYTDDTLLRHGVYEARESFLQKPFVIRSFASKVRETLDRN